MADYPRFLIAQNLMADPSTEYILHTASPRFLAKRDLNNAASRFEIVAEIDSLTDYTKMPGLMRRLEDWYTSYQKWQVKNKNLHQ